MYQNLIDEIESNIAEAQKLIDVVRNLPELDGIVRTQQYDERQVIMTAPYDYQILKRNAENLIAAGWKQYGEISPTQDGHAGLVTFYLGDSRWTGFVISMHMETDLPGATCKRNLLGYTQQAVYEITCLEA